MFRSKSNSARAALLALAVLSGGGVAAAQTPGDPSLDLRVGRSTSVLDPEKEREEAILTGRDDVVLLTHRKFFTVRGDVDQSFTNNARLSQSDRVSDNFTTASGSIRVETRLANMVDVHGEVGVTTSRYQDEGQLDYSAITSSFGAHMMVQGVDFDAAYTPIVIYDRKFEEKQLTQHRFIASAGKTFALPFSTSLRLGASVERIEADPDPYSNSAISLSAVAGMPLWREQNVTGFVSVRGVKRTYDNYFEGLLGDKRQDDLAEGAIGVSWTPLPNVQLQARWTEQKNWSSSDVNVYRASTGGLSVTGALRF